MKILSIESSCDDTAAAVVQDGRIILSNVVYSQIEEHKLYGGVVPEIASRRHTENICAVVERALADANENYDSIDALAVTYAPGLIGALLVGVNFAKGLSLALRKPVIPVHHLRSHIAANYLSNPDLEPPFTALVVSGGHSHIVRVKGYTDFEILGRTRDDAAGECLDKAARAMGLPYPGGVNLDKRCVNGDDEAFQFPHPSVDGHPLDFSFSGLKTYVINTINSCKMRGAEIPVEDIGASFMRAVSDILCENLMLACDNYDDGKVVIAGGVSANSVLRKKINKACEKRGLKLFVPPLSLCGDNGAMVGAQGYYEYLSGNIAKPDLNAYATMSINQIIL